MDDRKLPIAINSIFLNVCGLYYKPMTIINDDSRIVNKLETSLTVDARVIIYDRHMFIVQATGGPHLNLCQVLL
jgi:hypothetical protein